MTAIKAHLEAVFGSLAIACPVPAEQPVQSIPCTAPKWRSTASTGCTGYQNEFTERVEIAAERSPEQDTIDEREAIIAVDGGIPLTYVTSYNCFIRTVPIGADPERHQRAIDDAGRLFDLWGDTLVAMGWQSSDFFDWSEGCAGLAWEMRGRHVVALTDRTATIAGDSRTEISIFARVSDKRLSSPGMKGVPERQD